ncbi:MAG: hypothetical protein KDA33_07920 [Phycisphaerales bacterium]|nr:hypothetical protein [Phycisphaerales bacterium]
MKLRRGVVMRHSDQPVHLRGKSIEFTERRLDMFQRHLWRRTRVVRLIDDGEEPGAGGVSPIALVALMRRVCVVLRILKGEELVQNSDGGFDVAPSAMLIKVAGASPTVQVFNNGLGALDHSKFEILVA